MIAGDAAHDAAHGLASPHCSKNSYGMSDSCSPGAQAGAPMPVAAASRARFHLFTVPVSAGFIESPSESFHAIDMHIGGPVRASCRIDGREGPGTQTHGAFSVLPGGVTGRWLMARPAHALLMMLSPAIVDDAADAMGLRARAGELLPSIQIRDPQIERIAWILQAEHADGCPSGQLFIDSLASAVAARLLHLQSRAATARAPGRALPPRRLRDVLEYNDTHLDHDLALDELAAIAGYSVSHFKPLFKSAVGVPVHRYVIERRVARARELLLAGRHTIAQVALETGFTHQSHLARCMRRVLGVSPSQLALTR
jgi:AraC family transcriptional regulator